MRNTVFYEWVFEEYDENQDIIDPLFSDSLQEAFSNVRDIDPSHTYGIALVRFVGNRDDGEVGRQYAYINECELLPLEFEEGQKVPEKYHTEVRTLF